jgi:hypothetical protein
MELPICMVAVLLIRKRAEPARKDVFPDKKDDGVVPVFEIPIAEDDLANLLNILLPPFLRRLEVCF